jgi:thiosulfate dehydrogenase
MTLKSFASLFSTVCAAATGATLLSHPPGTATPTVFVPTTSRPPTSWPDYSAGGPGFVMPEGTDGPLIAYGYQLVSRTYAVIGPGMDRPSMRFAGNNLSCQNCHLDGGTNRHALPLAGIYKTFPKFSPRDRRAISMAERLNECMVRSMNGRALPEESPEMQALVAFVRYLGDLPPAPPMPPVEPPAQPPDATRGAMVFQTICATCHQPNGLGLHRGPIGDREGYIFPPLWGPDSYNDGAGMDRYQRIVGFVRHNMPRGVDPLHPQLTLQQGWDVSAFVIAQPRPHYGPSR